MDAAKLTAVQREMANRNTRALLVIRNDRIVLEWYAEGTGSDKPQGTASLAKSLVGGMSLLVALNDGCMAVDDPVSKYVPEWKSDPRRSKVTIRQLATHCSGVEDAEDSGKPHDQLPGWKGEFWAQPKIPRPRAVVETTPNPITIALRQAPVVFEPGASFAYSNPGMAVLTYAITASLKGRRDADVRSLLEHRIMSPIGVRPGEWGVGYDRTYLVNGLPVVPNWGGARFTPRAAARVGRLMMRKGSWDGQQLVQPQWVERMLSEPGTARPEGLSRLGTPVLCWYSNRDGVWPNLPRDAFRGSGNGDQVMMVVPSLRLIVVRNGSFISRENKSSEDFQHALNRYLFDPIVAAVVR